MVNQPLEKPLRGLPDPKRCETRNMGSEDDPFECLVSSPNSCQFALNAGKWVYCFHPDRSKFERPAETPPD